MALAPRELGPGPAPKALRRAAFDAPGSLQSTAMGSCAAPGMFDTMSPLHSEMAWGSLPSSPAAVAAAPMAWPAGRASLGGAASEQDREEHRRGLASHARCLASSPGPVPASPSSRSPGHRRGPGPEYLAGAVGSAAMLENHRQGARVSALLEADAPMAARPRRPSFRRSSTKGDGAEQSFEQMSGSFEQQLGSVEQILESLAQKRRGDGGVIGDSAEDMRRRAEEERQAREEEKRRRLQEQQNARDPKRTIALRLEVAREAAQAPEPKRSKVPMCKVDFKSSKGHELVQMVDVKLLQAQCQQLDHGVSVRSLMELSATREKFSRMCAPQGSSAMSTCSSAPSFSRASSASGSRAENRVLDVRARRHQQDFDRSLKRLSAMRSRAPESALERFEAASADLLFASAVEAAISGRPPRRQRLPPVEDEGEEAPRRPRRGRGSAVHAAGAEALARRAEALFPQDPRGLSRSSTRSQFFATCVQHQGFDLTTDLAEQVFNQRPPTAVGKTTSTDFVATLLARAAEESAAGSRALVKQPTRFELVMRKKIAQERARALIRSLRGVVKVLLVYFGHMRRRRSSDVIQIFMRRLVEMNRIKFSVHQFSSKVRRINEACRRYLKVRRERLRKLHKVWETVEDKHLKDYVEVNVEALLDEVGLRPSDKASHPAAMVVLDWTRMRLPLNERESIIKRFYAAALQKRIYAESRLVEAILDARRVSQDLAAFYDFRHEVSERTRLVGRGGKVREFWEMSQEVALDLIALTAFALRAMQPFDKHPAVLKPSGGPPALRANPLVGRGLGETASKSYGALLLPSQETEGRSAGLSRAPLAKAFASDHPRRLMEMWSRSSNLEELISRFTPRMLEKESDTESVPSGASTIRTPSRGSSRRSTGARAPLPGGSGPGGAARRSGGGRRKSGAAAP